MATKPPTSLFYGMSATIPLHITPRRFHPEFTKSQSLTLTPRPSGNIQRKDIASAASRAGRNAEGRARVMGILQELKMDKINLFFDGTTSIHIGWLGVSLKMDPQKMAGFQMDDL